MIRATRAKLRMLASDVVLLFVLLGVDWGGEVEDCGEEDDMSAAESAVLQAHKDPDWLETDVTVRRRDDSSA